jgi:hypothetical protein
VRGRGIDVSTLACDYSPDLFLFVGDAQRSLLPIPVGASSHGLTGPSMHQRSHVIHRILVFFSLGTRNAPFTSYCSSTGYFYGSPRVEIKTQLV